MKHGTYYGAAVNISSLEKNGEWIVGPRNHFGTGIYFAMSNKVAEHYADDIVIHARVSLGKNVNISMIPDDVNDRIGNDGNIVAEWGRKNGITSFEHWREYGNSGWWEYVLLYPPTGRKVRTTKIRILFVYNIKGKKNQRIYGGKVLWLHGCFGSENKLCL
jgi:hypothetical protein